MAKTKGNSSNGMKVSFGKKGKGKYQKKRNKHDKSEKNYRGQGR